MLVFHASRSGTWDSAHYSISSVYFIYFNISFLIYFNSSNHWSWPRTSDIIKKYLRARQNNKHFRLIDRISNIDDGIIKSVIREYRLGTTLADIKRLWQDSWIYRLHKHLQVVLNFRIQYLFNYLDIDRLTANYY